MVSQIVVPVTSDLINITQYVLDCEKNSNRKNYILRFAVLADTNVPYPGVEMRLLQPSDGRYLIYCQNGSTGQYKSLEIDVRVFWLYWDL